MKKLLIPLLLILSLTHLNAGLCVDQYPLYLEELEANSPEKFFTNQYKTYHTSPEALITAAKFAANDGDYYDHSAEFRYTKEYGENMIMLVEYYINMTMLLISDECDIPQEIADQISLFGGQWTQVLENSRKTSTQPSSAPALADCFTSHEHGTQDMIDCMKAATSGNPFAYTVFDWQTNTQNTYDKLVAYIRELLTIAESASDEL